MARKRERIFALFGAILFLGTSSALTVAVVMSMVQQHNQQKKVADATKSLQTKVKDNKNMLQGTILANFTPVSKISELQKIDTTVGTGQEVKSGDTVTVDYTGAVASSGVIFQSSKDSGQVATFPLSQVIPGWTQGIPGMKVDGTRRLLIPAVLAYGANPPSKDIPANADLVFDVTLHKIGQ